MTRKVLKRDWLGLAVAICWVLIFAYIMLATPTAKGAEPSYWPSAEYMVEQINHERQRHGLKPLKTDPALMKCCNNWSWRMARMRRMFHGGECSRLRRSENVAMHSGGYKLAIRQWMNSPGHRAAILSRSATRVGAGAWRAGRRGAWYSTAQFR